MSLLLGLLPGVGISPAAGCGHPGTADRFDINADGTVTDIESGLTWMRCSTGQSWQGNDCQGEARSLDWTDAVAAVVQYNQRHAAVQGSTWRLPHLNELATLAERDCGVPRIDLRMFPATPAHAYWSADDVPRSDDGVYVLSFDQRGVFASDKDTRHFLRLVRGRDH